MLTLTTPITVPNVTKIHVDSVALDSNTNTGIVVCSVQCAGVIPYGGPLILTVRDGAGNAQGIRATVTPLGVLDRLEVFAHATAATAFTDLVAAYSAGGGVGVKNKAAESALLAAGLLPPGAVA